MKIINRKCPNQLIKPKLINIFSDEFRMVSFTNIKNSLQPTNGLLQLILEILYHLLWTDFISQLHPPELNQCATTSKWKTTDVLLHFTADTRCRLTPKQNRFELKKLTFKIVIYWTETGFSILRTSFMILSMLMLMYHQPQR